MNSCPEFAQLSGVYLHPAAWRAGYHHDPFLHVDFFPRHREEEALFTGASPHFSGLNLNCRHQCFAAVTATGGGRLSASSPG